ncbi:MAG: hypothetical protein HYY06_13105 [Deltaproteobacteria bacterium]|nr:hypothetical protein [Deltaproteobacteria bacterium]
MTAKPRAKDAPERLAPPHRRILLSVRLTPENADALRALAGRAGVGPSTMARLIVERYIADHLSRSRRK